MIRARSAPPPLDARSLSRARGRLVAWPRLSDESGETRKVVIIILSVIIGILLVYKLIGVGADYAAESISDKTETDLFADFGKGQKGWRVTPADDRDKRVQAIFQRLVKAKGMRALKYELYFLPEKDPNAFALPGGCVGVTKGLLDLVTGDVGLAMVLAHELGHQQHRDSLRQMGRSLALSTILTIAGGNSTFLLGTVVGLAERSHSRKQELAADDYGIRLVHRLYGTTEGTLEFFTKIQAKTALPGGRVLGMLSTHPLTPDRIERLKKISQELAAADAGGGAASGKKKMLAPGKPKKPLTH
jgi:Zn-dependent protease with chaperone function